MGGTTKTTWDLANRVSEHHQLCSGDGKVWGEVLFWPKASLVPRRAERDETEMRQGRVQDAAELSESLALQVCLFRQVLPTSVGTGVSPSRGRSLSISSALQVSPPLRLVKETATDGMRPSPPQPFVPLGSAVKRALF